MVSRACATNRIGILAVGLALIVSVGCDRPGTSEGPDKSSFAFASPVAVSPFITTAIIPQQVGLAPALGVLCVGFPAVTTSVTLVFNTSPGDNLFIQNIGFRLLDVSQIGGSPLVVSASDISARFGSTMIRGGSQRSLTFDPQFGCGTFTPRFFAADVDVVDEHGNQHKTRTVVPTH